MQMQVFKRNRTNNSLNLEPFSLFHVNLLNMLPTNVRYLLANFYKQYIDILYTVNFYILIFSL